MVRPPIITPSAIWAISSIGDQGQRFALRFLRRFRADLSIKKSSSFFPPLIAATSQRGLAPRPAHVSPEGLRYFGGTFFPFNALPLPRTTLRPPVKAVNCFSSSARRLCSVSSTRSRRSMRASTFIPDRFTFGIVISDAWNCTFWRWLALALSLIPPAMLDCAFSKEKRHENDAVVCLLGNVCVPCKR